MKQKVFKAKDYLNSKPPTLIYKDQKYINCGCDLVTNLVTIKNVKTREVEEIDFYELQKRME